MAPREPLLSHLPPLPRNERAPWTWMCHRCRKWYRLGTTRRCLSCGHTFCQTLIHKAGHSPPTSISKRKRKDLRGGPCSAEFDFIGWAAWGSYRRALLKNRHTRRLRAQQQPLTSSLPWPILLDRDIDVLEAMDGITNLTTYATHAPSPVRPCIWTPLPPSEVNLATTAKEALYSSGKHNCWVHCDYPSECRHSLTDVLKRKEEEAECQKYDESVEGTCWDPSGDGMDESNVMSEEDEEVERGWDYESVYAQGEEGRETMVGTFETYEDEDEEDGEDRDGEQDDEAEEEEESDEWDEWSDADTRGSDSSSSSSDSNGSEESETSEEIDALCSLTCHEAS